MNNFFEDNSFDIIALPPPQLIQPCDFNLEGLHDWNEFTEPPCYTELTTFSRQTFSTSSSTSSFTTSDSLATELEQFLIFDYDDSITMTTFDNLPDQTLMCTDSCSQFLKESSDILRENSLKFQRMEKLEIHNSSAIDNVIDVLTEQRDKVDAENVEADKVFFNCTIDGCKKTYSKPAHLRAHLRRHLGLKPYHCHFENCSWRFSRSDELARHQRSHSGIKPYNCFYCSKTFSRSDHLKKHIKIHEKKLKDGKLKFKWDEIPKQKPGRKKKIHIIET